MNFNESLAYLLSLGHETLAMKFGLENTERLLNALRHPERLFFKIQIAGTNGKGSTAVMLDHITRAAGIRTALYTSPHLVSITERMRFDGQEIDPRDFARHATKVRDAAQALVAAGALPALPTFFEHLTAMFFVGCTGARAELAILETGLGGRLDATTATNPQMVAITPVALDHQEYLGGTLEEIAGEKAAIIRPGTIAVIAPQPPEVLNVILNRCAECGVQPVHADFETKVTGADARGRLRVTFKTRHEIYEDVWLSLPGRHQIVNAAVALAITEALIERGFKISHQAIRDGLESASHPGRLEWREGVPAFLFDGAHNIAGARALGDYLNEFVKAPLTIIFGAMRDKDLALMAEALFPAAEHLILTELDNARSATREMLAQLASHHPNMSRVILTSNVSEALRAAMSQTEPVGVICVTGSLYLIGEAQALLHRVPDEIYAT
ncbi:MAG: bifunctional folylpolyglutamate synthase/dihydrofolate synthase [Pyrinomonadaceae bacterium]|nr:bifunctional folylpolyglutamate synthase/dihydrofolate synthase [Pyrinomonadaceae bacterium]